MEDNAAVRIWAETTQQENGDSLIEGCFTFGKVDLVPTVEEYTALIRCPKIQIDKAYSRAANILEHMPKSRRREIHRMRTTLTSVVPQPFLESGKGLILNLLRKLFSAERVSGYAEKG
ncbi:hypothetical protein Gogos_001017 [Gossypium gossypioides]|uniref:Uncharacterized protein n=1 Tax=Gossypium gossypioides TaxID=34282 RepID=A0A7J9CV92_GOSGO|nr:hypothetical protein [Gossypium gossypioides]